MGAVVASTARERLVCGGALTALYPASYVWCVLCTNRLIVGNTSDSFSLSDVQLTMCDYVQLMRKRIRRPTVLNITPNLVLIIPNRYKKKNSPHIQLGTLAGVASAPSDV